MMTALKLLYEKEMDLQEALTKIRLKPLRKPGDLNKAVKLEQAIVDVANEIRKLKTNER